MYDVTSEEIIYMNLKNDAIYDPNQLLLITEG